MREEVFFEFLGDEGFDVFGPVPPVEGHSSEDLPAGGEGGEILGEGGRVFAVGAKMLADSVDAAIGGFGIVELEFLEVGREEIGENFGIWGWGRNYWDGSGVQRRTASEPSPSPYKKECD